MCKRRTDTDNHTVYTVPATSVCARICMICTRVGMYVRKRLMCLFSVGFTHGPSSSRRMAGFLMMALAMAMRCFCPPLNCHDTNRHDPQHSSVDTPSTSEWWFAPCCYIDASIIA
eukprot:54928-Eustigmatos_ZCMA.PRE.1